MASLENKFTKYIRKHHSKSARVIWPPDSPPIRPGDYGLVKDGAFNPFAPFAKGPFIRIGNLEDKGIDLAVDAGSPSSFTLELSSKVSFRAVGSGSIPQIPGLDAALELAFGEEGAAVISGDGVTAPRLSDLDAIRKALISLHSRGEWDSDYRLIYQVRHFPSAFIAISKSNSGKLVLGLKGTQIPALESLGKAEVDVSVAFESGGFLKLTNAKNVTPIVYAARLKRKQIGFNLVPETLIGTEEGFELIEDAEISESFDAADYQELAESMAVVENEPPPTVTLLSQQTEASSNSTINPASPSRLEGLAVFGSAEALTATEENEPDDSGNDELSLERAARRNMDSTSFDDFIHSLNLRYFQPAEFLVMGGSNGNANSSCYNLNGPPPRELWPNIIRTAQVLDELRHRLGASIRLSSVYRNERYNSCIGGARYSQHKRFNAADFTTGGMSSREVARALFRLRNEGFFQGGIGLYSSFVHVDTRGSNAQWAGSGMSLDGVS